MVKSWNQIIIPALKFSIKDFPDWLSATLVGYEFQLIISFLLVDINLFSDHLVIVMLQEVFLSWSNSFNCNILGVGRELLNLIINVTTHMEINLFTATTFHCTTQTLGWRAGEGWIQNWFLQTPFYNLQKGTLSVSLYHKHGLVRSWTSESFLTIANWRLNAQENQHCRFFLLISVRLPQSPYPIICIKICPWSLYGH